MNQRNILNVKQDRVVNSSGIEKIYTLTDGLTDVQKSDLYSEVALAKNWWGYKDLGKKLSLNISCKIFFELNLGN